MQRNGSMHAFAFKESKKLKPSPCSVNCYIWAAGGQNVPVGGSPGHVKFQPRVNHLKPRVKNASAEHGRQNSVDGSRRRTRTTSKQRPATVEPRQWMDFSLRIMAARNRSDLPQPSTAVARPACRTTVSVQGKPVVFFLEKPPALIKSLPRPGLAVHSGSPTVDAAACTAVPQNPSHLH